MQRDSTRRKRPWSLDDGIRSASSQCGSDILDEHRMRCGSRHQIRIVDSADVESCDKSNLLALGKTIVWWTGENGCVATVRAWWLSCSRAVLLLGPGFAFDHRSRDQHTKQNSRTSRKWRAASSKRERKRERERETHVSQPPNYEVPRECIWAKKTPKPLMCLVACIGTHHTTRLPLVDRVVMTKVPTTYMCLFFGFGSAFVPFSIISIEP